MDDLRTAFAEADRLTKHTAREHIVRNRGFAHKPDYIVVPRYEAGFEGYRHDGGYAGLGLWVTERPS
ncbi:MAG TPA: hypothetical protein VFG22_10535 [Polyangiales bacterium]|nr:hypothetical protein [Polyangiales bacterium]